MACVVAPNRNGLDDWQPNVNTSVFLDWISLNAFAN